MTSEADIERSCRHYALSKKCLFVKMQGEAGWPDRLVLLPNGRHMFVEFKKLGGELSPLQRHVMHTIREHNHEAFEVDNVSLFRRLVNERL